MDSTVNTPISLQRVEDLFLFYLIEYTWVQARKTFKIAWEPEFPRKIAFEHFEVKPTPITLINLVLCRKGPL